MPSLNSTAFSGLVCDRTKKPSSAAAIEYEDSKNRV
jgi:hypothetical protein